MKKLTLSAVLCALVCAATVEVHFTTTSRDIVAARVSAAVMKDTDRAEKLRQMLAAAGCPANQLQVQPVKHLKTSNIICTIPGDTTSQIVVGAHSDHAEHGLGVIDDWSGAALLPSLLESIKSTARRHTFVFTGFTGEEEGLLGSRYYVGHLAKEELRQIAAMIDFDSVGTGPVEVESATADKALLEHLLQTAHSLNMPLKFVNVNQVGTSDFAVFRAKGVPSLIMHSVTQENWRLLHTNKDNLDALRMDDYYNTYKLAAVYLAYLDVVLDPPQQ